MRHSCILEVCCFSSGVYFIMHWEILTEIRKTIGQYCLCHGMDWVRLLHPMGSFTNISARKSLLCGRVHICNFFLETAS